MLSYVPLTRNRLSLDEQTTLTRNFLAIFHPTPILTSWSAILNYGRLPLTTSVFQCALVLCAYIWIKSANLWGWGSMFSSKASKDRKHSRVRWSSFSAIFLRRFLFKQVKGMETFLHFILLFRKQVVYWLRKCARASLTTGQINSKCFIIQGLDGFGRTFLCLF